MDLTPTVLIVLGVLFVLMAVEVPVGFSLGVSGALGLGLLSGADVAGSTVARLPFQYSASYTLVVIPMFVAMGVFAKNAGMAEGLFRLAARRLRVVPGGLALAALFACAGFAAVSGSSIATVVSVGRLSIEEMRKQGYSAAFAAGVIGAAGTLGVLIPPSIILVIYGILTGESIGLLLIAGIVPGLLSASLYAVAIVYRAYRHPELAGGEWRTSKVSSNPVLDVPLESSPGPTSREARSTPPGNFGGLVRVGVLVVVVVGGIYSGRFTVIESAAMGAVVAFVILVVDSLRLSVRTLWSRFRESIIEAISINSMVFMLVIGAGIFSAFVISARLPQLFTGWALDLPVPGMLLILILILAFVPLGMFLDPLSIMLIGVPLAYPVVTGLGFDGIWFGILIVKTVEIGLITPPLGINAYIVAGTADDIDVATAFRGILWFLPVDLLTLLVLFLFPGIVTWLPNAMQ